MLIFSKVGTLLHRHSVTLLYNIILIPIIQAFNNKFEGKIIFIRQLFLENINFLIIVIYYYIILKI